MPEMTWGLIVALVAAGYLARWTQAQWTWPLMRVQCRRHFGNTIEDSRNGIPYSRCINTVWRIRWGRLAPLGVRCRECQKAEGMMA